MGKEGFDWTLARSFLAVLDAGSLSAAAQRLRLQQPTLSRHVAAFEAQLGTPLFERSGRGMVPTAAAQAIAAAARRMEQGAAALQQQLRRRREATRGTVRVTTSEVAASWLLPPVLASLREADIAVRMVRPAQASLVAREQVVLRTDDQRA